MKKFLAIAFAVLSLTFAARAQKAEFTAVTSADTCTGNGVVATLSYTLPADNPIVVAATATNDASMQPTTAIWYWGDEESGAATRHFTKANYGQTVNHSYAKPGVYGIFVVVVDAKNRSIRQASIKITIQPQVVIE
jgi:hypothetical protein